MRGCQFVVQTIVSWTIVCFAASSLPNPRIVEHPQDGYIAKDEPASLNCRAEGEPKPEITWYRNGRKVETTPENPFSNRMIFPDGKLFFLSVVHNKKDKTDVGVYYCNATNIHGTAISRNATLSIAVLRSDFRVQPKNVTAAIGDSVSFPCRPPRGEPEPRIIWKKDTELIIQDPSHTRFVVTDNGALNISQVRKQDAGIFRCIATNDAGERESAPAVLRVIEKPSFRRFPIDVTTREKKTVEFPCDVVGDKPLQVTWRKEHGNIGRISTLRDHTLRIEDVSRHDSGIYVCVAKNQVGEAEAVARLNVEYKPEFKVRPVDKSVGVGRSVSLQCVVEGNPPPTIYWRKRSQHASAEKSLIFPYKPDGRYSVKPDGTLQIDHVQPADAGEFECEALNTIGTASTSVQLKVRENDSRPPPVIRIVPQNQTLATDETALLHCDAFGNPQPIVQWYKNGNLLSSDDPRIQQKSSNTLQISGLRVSDTGMYSCKASSETGETTWIASLVVEVPDGSSVLFHRAQDSKYFPGPPSQPVAIETKDTSIMLSWQPNSNSGASPVFEYIVEYFSHETTDGWVVVPDTIQKDKYTVKNLKPGTPYIFLVRARNSHGIGNPSLFSQTITTDRSKSEIAVAVPADEIRTRMSGIVVQIEKGGAVNSSAIRFEWKPVKEEELIQHYEIVYKRLYNLEDMTAGQPHRVLVQRHASKDHMESHTISNLNSHAWYQICVKAFNGDIGSQCSSPLKVRTRESVPSNPPQNIIINKHGKTRVFVQWLPPPVESRNGDVKGYEIKCLSDDGKHDCSVSINGTSNKYTINNLQEDVTYSIQIAARTSKGVGVWSQSYVIGPEQPSLMEEPWFIGVLIGVVGGTLWLALCVFSIWLCKKRKSKKKMMQNGLYTVPMQKGNEQQPCTTFYRNGYGEKDTQHMSPEITNLLDGHKEVEMQDQNIYNVPQMKTFYHKQDPVAPYATTTLINPGAAQHMDHMFRPINQHSGSGDSCCKHDCSGSNTDSGGHHHSDHMQSPTSDSGSHTTDENGMLIKKGRKGQGQIIVPKQAMVNWAEFLPPPPEHPPPSEVGSDSPANSLQYAEVSQNRAMANRSPMSPMSKISSCSCPAPHSQHPGCAQAWNVPPPAYSDSGCVRCCSPKYCDNGQYSAINRVQSPRSDTWGQRTIACTNPSQRAPVEMYCHSRTCHSDHEQNSVPPFHHYKINNNEQDGGGEYQCFSDSGHYSRCPVDGHCMDRACQSSLPSVASECQSRGPCRLSDGGHHHMNLAVEGYHRNGDSPMSGGQDYVGESDSESNPPQDGEDCGDENPEDEGNVSGSMMASWASVTDQSNTDCSSHRSSAASDSDASFLTEADFASAVAKAAELSGLTVVGTTVCDPKTGKPVKRHRRPRPARPVSPYSTDSNFSAVPHRPYPKSQRKKQLIEQGKWQRKDQPNGVPSQNLPANGGIGLMKV
ncbi:roundabout, axon guidance receptor 1 [Mytilus galloprovincialis]|uniref:Roundabout, axon guidance receptor 1 n=1 Tax=Mytilus galloprovincialis TaxID=29158 RepID=A0A8B6CQY5_MYTGA|nr:roundabout, axon guidance receptor 1 [Mytilus galloprovincialis]